MYASLACFVYGCSSTSKNVNAQLTQQATETRIYEVFGMDCPGCHVGIEKLVRKIENVHDVAANWKEKQLVVMIKMGIKLDDELIYDAIKRANFTSGMRVK